MPLNCTSAATSSVLFALRATTGMETTMQKHELKIIMEIRATRQKPAA
jgi:hypothetical protein